MDPGAWVVIALIAGVILAFVTVVVAGAVENIRIAKHTGRDPRTRTTMTLKGSGEKTSQAVVEAGERLTRDGST